MLDDFIISREKEITDMSIINEMHDVDDLYFEEEHREGFCITEMMKRSWAAQIHLLRILEEFFDKYDIKYYATWGTLLGAIRHQGFIPWDDDIDINITRKDFRTLLDHADELPHGIWILSIYSSDDYYNFHAVVKNNRRDLQSIFDEDREREFCGFPFMTGIDIYILDNIPDDESEMRAQKSLYEFGYSLVHRYAEIEKKSKEGEAVSEEEIELFLDHTEQYLEQVGKVYGEAFSIDGDRPLINELCRLVDGIASYYSECSCKKVSSFTQCPGKALELWGYEASWYGKPQRVPFEYSEICIPEGYTNLLVKMFGENYMTPRMTGGKHEYPQYSKPAKVLGFNIEYEELQDILKQSAKEDIDSYDTDVRCVIVAYSIDSLIKYGGEILDKIEADLRKYASNAALRVCWYSFGLYKENNILLRSIPNTMSAYKSLKEKYINTNNIIDGARLPMEWVVERCQVICGEGSILDAYIK